MKSGYKMLLCKLPVKLFRCQISFLTDYRLKKSLYVKLKDWMSNSLDQDETAHMSRLN